MFMYIHFYSWSKFIIDQNILNSTVFLSFVMQVAYENAWKLYTSLLVDTRKCIWLLRKEKYHDAFEGSTLTFRSLVSFQPLAPQG